MIKITKDSKLMIWGATADVTTGGAEVLHKLGAYMKSLGVNAKMFNYSYYVYEQSDYYRNLYDVNCGSWEEIVDDENLIVLLPEVMIENPNNLEFFCSFKKTQFIIWWLSSGFDYADKEKKTSKRRIMLGLKRIEDRCLNLYENELCARDLLYHGLNNRMRFQHGLHPLFYTQPKMAEKQDIVMYNGCKPMTKNFVEENLVPNLPDVKFICCSFNNDHYFTKEEMIEMYDSAKVYIDFPDFEGREMCPREAAIRDCILLLNNEGNAATFDDYPIPSWYKVHKYTDSDIKEICLKIKECLKHYDTRIHDFSLFKRKCLFEPKQFEMSVHTIFGDMIPEENKIVHE